MTFREVQMGNQCYECGGQDRNHSESCSQVGEDPDQVSDVFTDRDGDRVFGVLDFGDQNNYTLRPNDR